MPCGRKCAIIHFVMENEFSNNSQLKAIVSSISEYCHVLGQPSTMILSSIELLKMPKIDDATRQMACDTCYEAALEIKKILGEMKRKCAYAENKAST